MQPETLLGESVLRSALTDEFGTDILKFRSLNDLLFRDRTSLASTTPWSPTGYRALAKVIQPVLKRLYGRVPLEVFQHCLDACGYVKLRHLDRYGLRTVRRNGIIEGVAGWRSLQVRPSVILSSLLSFPAGSVSVQYLDLNLTALILLRHPDSSCSTMKLRVLLQDGWTLRKCGPIWYKGTEPTWSDRFREWRAPDWETALLTIRTELMVPAVTRGQDVESQADRAFQHT